jgi:hypothetical protein
MNFNVRFQEEGQMKRIHTLAAAMIALSALVAAPVSAQQPSAAVATAVEKGPGMVAGANVATVTAKVVAIDKDKRLVTLQGPLGNQFRVVAGKEVRNFDQVKVGDELVVTHAEALTLELKKGGDGIRERVESQGAARAPAGGKPGMAEVNRVSIVGNVVAVNARTQTVTLRGVENTVELRVPDKNQFKPIKVGDQVQATFTEAVAVSMEPAAKK